MARVSDLIVLGQVDPQMPKATAARHMLDRLLMGAGRPVLVIPYAGSFPTIGQKVLIGWTDCREAARAVHDAIPIMKQAQSATALTVVSRRRMGDDTSVPGTDIVEHLKRHGVPASAARTVANDIADSDALLSYASDSGADLLVAGGYTHSRIREAALGGVTRELLQHMTIPVLMSH
jgi:nucleotide-binding universal stress UspA family protein